MGNDINAIYYDYINGTGSNFQGRKIDNHGQEIESENSLFDEYQNQSSITIDYSNQDNHEVLSPKKTRSSMNFEGDMAKYIQDNYGDVTDGQKNALAWAIVDNNRELVAEVNKTYLIYQTLEDLPENLEHEEEYINAVSAVILGEEADLSGLNQEEINAFNTIKTKFNNNEYLQYDKNVNVEDIPLEYIYGTQFNPHCKLIYNPQITTRDIGKLAASNMTGNNQYIPKGIELEINPKDSIDDIKQRIAENYGIDTLNSDIGISILHGIFNEENNNLVFDKENENVKIDDLIELIQYRAQEGAFTLKCPEVNVSYLHDGLSGDRLKEKSEATKDDAQMEIKYLHILKESVDVSELDKNATAVDLLKYVEYGNGTLYDMLYPNGKMTKDETVIALASSAVQQLIENNPELYSQYGDAFVDENGYTNAGILNLPVAELSRNAKDNKIQLENIAYIMHGLKPTPVPRATQKATSTPFVIEDNPTPTPNVTATPTAVVTATPNVTATPTPVVTATPNVTATPTAVVTATPNVTATPTPVVTPAPVTQTPPCEDPPEIGTTPSIPPTAVPLPKQTATPDATETPAPQATPTPPCGDPPTLDILPNKQGINIGAQTTPEPAGTPAPSEQTNNNDSNKENIEQEDKQNTDNQDKDSDCPDYSTGYGDDDTDSTEQTDVINVESLKRAIKYFNS